MLGYGSTQIKILSDNTLRFKHELDLHTEGGDTAEWSMLCEVGEPYQHRFTILMDAYSLVRGEPKTLDEFPWLADTVGSIDLTHRHKALLPDGSAVPFGQQWEVVK